MRCFTDDPAVIAEGVTIICMLAFFYPVFCCVEVFSSAMRGCGNSVMPTVLTLFGTCLLRLALLYTVTFPHLNNWTIAICYPATWGATSLLFLIYYRFFRWMPGPEAADIKRSRPHRAGSFYLQPQYGIVFRSAKR